MIEWLVLGGLAVVPLGLLIMQDRGGYMAKSKPRGKGDSYRPKVIVHKAKNGVPTSIELGGHKYAMVHDHYINGQKNQVKNRPHH